MGIQIKLKTNLLSKPTTFSGFFLKRNKYLIIIIIVNIFSIISIYNILHIVVVIAFKTIKRLF